MNRAHACRRYAAWRRYERRWPERHVITGRRFTDVVWLHRARRHRTTHHAPRTTHHAPRTRASKRTEVPGDATAHPQPPHHTTGRQPLMPTGWTGLTTLPGYPNFIDSQAKCKDADPDLFTPERLASPEPAKAYCRTCVHQAACLEWALETHQPNGIWGGKTAQERLHILKQGPE